MGFNVLIPNPIDPIGVELLEAAGATIIVPPNDEVETLLTFIPNIDAILARTEKYPKSIFQKAHRLKIIARHGIGVDNIDLDAATEHGVVVTNTPQANIHSVAELVIALMLAASRKLVAIDREVRKGNFQIRNKLFGSELRGKTLGVIGFGNIGRLVAEKCHAAFQMRISVYDPYTTKETVAPYVELKETLETLLNTSDIVTLHVPYVKETHHIINRETLKAMKQNGILINAARGGVVDELALYDALKKNELKGACLDVFEVEPPSKDHPLFSLDNVIVTPHLGAQTDEAYTLLAKMAAEEIIAVMNNRPPHFPVNYVKAHL
ncbi:hydroxyacid dehydrogenase [Gracilibacillus dipsosauri]|uniref:hydroxyacid dehydrogenase n=1 Tax=Gracilibacillus dipsosauri TaxID=178340 RepID=UPI00240A6857